MLDTLNLSKIKNPIPQKKFLEIKNSVLGNKYQLSLVLVNNQESKKINRRNRKKNKASNILSFPIEKNFGEIFLNLETKPEAKKFEMSWRKYLTFLFIHGCLHLKGYDHGPKMEKEEQKLLKKLY